jgi:methylated-DNA-[protein]-cysteine S-methyltransferase
VDVSYALVDSPLGALVAAVTGRGLVRLSYSEAHSDAVLEELARRVSPRVLEDRAALDDVMRELDEYFTGRRHRFELTIDWRLVPSGFARRVLQATKRVPFGRLTTYKDIAGKAGSPGAARAVGNALGANPIPIVVPCHRVVHADGSLGGYTGGLQRKRYLLRLEGAL